MWLFITHSAQNVPTSFYFDKNYKLFVAFMLLSILLVRFNIVNSVHNFINIESHNQYLYYIIYIIISTIFITIYYLLQDNNHPHKIATTLITHFFKILVICFLFICCINIFLKNVVSIQNIYLYITFLYLFFIFLKIDLGKVYVLVLLTCTVCY